MTFALIAAGGTGGHVYPALALADVLVRRGHDKASIRFVGGRRGLEGDAVTRRGFAVDLLPGRGLRRSLSPENVVALWEALVSSARALGLVRRLRPRVVVGFGGYASLPTVVAARALRVPSVVHEQNAAPGLANRISVSLGARAAGAMSGVALRRVVITGNPVRPEILDVVRRPMEPPQVLVTSGSLGARSVNLAALGLYDRWRDRNDVAVRHVTGRRDHAECVERLSASRRASDRLHYELVEYEHEMPAAYERSAVVVGRAGATTVAELTAVGMPSVLVPLPGAPGDHQTANAERLAAAGAALVLPDDRCTADALAGMLEPLVADPARLNMMGDAARDLGAPDAAERLADLVEGTARG